MCRMSCVKFVGETESANACDYDDDVRGMCMSCVKFVGGWVRVTMMMTGSWDV